MKKLLSGVVDSVVVDSPHYAEPSHCLAGVVLRFVRRTRTLGLFEIHKGLHTKGPIDS